MPLLDYQRRNFQKLKEELPRNNIIQVIAKCDSGRRYTIETLKSEYFVLSVHNDNKENSLNPIYNALNLFSDELKEIKVHLSFGMSIKNAFLGIDISKVDFNELESKLIHAVSRLRRKKPVVFVFNYYELSEVLENFIKKIVSVKYYLKHYPIYIIYLSEKGEFEGVKNINFETLSLNHVNKRSVLLDLGLNHHINLSTDELSFIFNITNGKISYLKNMVVSLNRSELSFSECKDENKSIISLLNQCFDDGKQRDAINKILAFCSYSDNFMLSKSDLNFLLNLNLIDINNYLKAVQSYNIIGLREDKLYIIISLLKAIYRQQFEAHKGEIYIRLCEMIAQMYPSNYKQKFIYAKYAEDVNEDIYYCQYCMQCIREHGSYTLDPGKQDFRFINLLSDYQLANHYLIHRKYDKVLCVLSSYLDLPYFLLVEVKLMIAKANMKKLDNDSRNKALIDLKAINKEKIDGNLKYRVSMFEVISNIHMGNYDDAYNIYDKLVSSLADERNSHASSELNYDYFTLLRKNNMVNNYQSSMLFIEQAKDYFSTREDLPVAYYLAITNSLGIHVKNMKLREAAIDISDMQKLKQKNSLLNFPREYIFENNYLVYKYLSGESQIHDIVKEFEMILKPMSNYADKYLITSNYAVFVALNGDINEAVKLFEQSYNDLKKEKEGIYLYKYRVNRAILLYILDNTNREKLIKDLSSIQLPKGYPNQYALKQETELIIKNMQLTCNSVDEWMQNYDSIRPKNRPKSSFELGFVITELFSWDDG